MEINYNHSTNIHTASGAASALSILLANEQISSVLDVGCGTGLWLQSALELGIPDVLGVEGVDIPDKQLNVSPEMIYKHDLTKEFDLKKTFDLVLCLEVGEHLESEYASTLIRSLTNHGQKIFFSAACPSQPGQHHVNCQWPEYWQQLFNSHGFSCNDSIRHTIWENNDIEWWYRQNLFEARYDPNLAGHEPRIQRIIHPGMLELAQMHAYQEGHTKGYAAHRKRFKCGQMPYYYYLAMPLLAAAFKLRRLFLR